MSETPTALLSDLLARLRLGEVTLLDVVEQLNKRGPVASVLHRAELAALDQALKSSQLDARVHRMLVSKLNQLQASTTQTSAPKAPPSDEATRLNTAAPVQGDQTALNPAPPAGGAEEILDLSMPGAIEQANERTRVTGTGSEGNTTFIPKPGPETSAPSRSGATSSPSSWERVASRDAPDRDVMAGDTLKGRFYLEKELGRGGMGVVYKARDERKVEAQDRNPWVAVKVLNDEFRRHPQSLIALQREARKAQQLTHDNVLRVFDFDKDGAIVYITMEYVDGGTLKDFIKQFKTGLPFAEARPIIDGLARGLARAHRDGIVHSDFKPGNVMMTEERIPKIFDLGIARAAKTSGEAKAAGETTVFDASTLGALTPAYASLEMLRGESPQIPDDIYALGITAYELLTGRHPFKKKTAEDAFKAGLKPEKIPGLSRRQWRTIEKALAFNRTERLQTAEEMIEGLRPRTTRELAIPIVGGAMGLLLLLFVVLGPVRSYFKQQSIDNLVRRFEAGQFAGTEEALAELDRLDAQDRNVTLQQSSTPIQDYFFKLAEQLWNPDKGLYDYPAALAILNQADALYGRDSRRISEALARIEAEKNQTLSRLNDQYAQQLAAGRLFDSQDNSAARTLAAVRLIDANHPLLKDTRLQLAYAGVIRQLIQSGDLTQAEQRVASALKDYPEAAALKSLAGDVKALRDAELAVVRQKEQAAQAAKLTEEQARDQLVQLAAKPEFSADWQGQVEAALKKMAGDTSPKVVESRNSLAGAYARQIAKQTGEKQLVSAQLLADRALQFFPGDARVLAEKSKLDLARKAFDAEQASLNAAAETEGLKQTFLTRAAANDIRKAEQTLADLKTRLPATDGFLTDTAPRAVADAYGRMAERQAAQNKFGEALRLVATGLKALPDYAPLKTLEKKFALEGKVAEIQAGIARPDAISADAIRAAVQIVQAEDAARAKKLAEELVKKITALAGSDPAAAKTAKAEWLKVYPDNKALAAITIAERASTPAAEPAPAASEAAPAPSASAPATEVAKAEPGFTRPASDPCKPDFASFGSNSRATCVDVLAGGGQGPRLVVVPGERGAAPYAISKFEVTIGQFNAFCSATGQCAPAEGAANLPRVGVSVAQARAYAEWLSRNSGFRYRLPSESEWEHAVSAQGGGVGDDFNCVLMQGTQQIKGGVGIAVNVGKPNPWGVLNGVGNAAEWVEAPLGPLLRGGDFNTQMTRCTVEWRETGGVPTAGVRLVRELDGRSRG